MLNVSEFHRLAFGIDSAHVRDSESKEKAKAVEETATLTNMEDEAVPEVKKARLETSPPLYGSLELIYHDSTEKQRAR